jgi:SSS family solute:Na+ symporter
MQSNFAPIDYIVFIAYGLMIITIGLLVSRTKKGMQKTAQDYFLASRSLTWWAIGASLLAANISAEHFIAMSGSGYAIGLAIASYEWIAAFALIIVGKYFLPIFLKKQIFTMPQFCEQRFDRRVGTSLAVFWLLVYVFVNLTSVIYLGALAMEKILDVPIMYGIIGLALFAALYSLYGGLTAVAWTDVVQVVFLVGGGLITSYLGLNAVSGGEGFIEGFRILIERAPDKFHMIIEQGQSIIPDTLDDAGNVVSTKDAFKDLPGLAVIVGGLWITNFGYWGFNQYIIQRGLAAKSMKDAKKGLIFAGYLKILVPLLVVIPGIAAYVLNADIGRSDEAYPWLLANYVPAGIKGLAFAALAAAIVSSLASMINSTSTIFTMDIYRSYINKNATDKQLVRVGRIVAFVALFIAVLVAPNLKSLDQVFQYIQEYTAFVYPGTLVIFFMGLLWKQATTNAALWVAILTLPLGAAFKIFSGDTPFIIRMGYVFIILTVVGVVISLMEKGCKVEGELPNPKRQKQDKIMGSGFIGLGLVIAIVSSFYIKAMAHLALHSIYVLATGFILIGLTLIFNATIKLVDRKALIIERSLFKTGTAFNIGAAGICGILFLLYFSFW